MKHKILLLGCLALGLFSCKNDEMEYFGDLEDGVLQTSITLDK